MSFRMSFGRSIVRFERQCQRYERQLKLGSIPSRSDGDKGTQALDYKRSCQIQSELEQRARLLLFRSGVHLVWLSSYLNFVRHVFKLKRTLCRQALSYEARVAIVRWTGQGLRQHLLERLCRELLEVEPAEETEEGIEPKAAKQ
jgi:hypothetical protein